MYMYIVSAMMAVRSTLPAVGMSKAPMAFNFA